MNHHMCETWSQHTWWLCSRPGFGPLKSGCDRSGIRGMLTIGRNLDRTGQPFFTYLTLITLTFLLPKTNVDFTLWNPVPKVILGIGELILGTKTKLFLGIYTLKCLFLWYLSDLDLWLIMMGCGVMSIITSAYTYKHK